MKKLFNTIQFPYDWIIITFSFLVVIIVIFNSTNSLTKNIWNILNSNFFQGLATMIAAFIAVVGGLLTYFTQQRVNNLRRIYFEETFLDSIKDIENGIGSCNRFVYLSGEIINLISNLIKQTYVDRDTFFARIELLRIQISQDIKFQYFKDIPKGRMEEIFYGNKNYLVQWIDKAQENFIYFSGLVRGQMDMLINDLKMNEIRNKERDKKMLDDIHQNIQNQYRLIQRHYTLLYYLARLISKFNLCKYHSINELIKFSQKKEIKKLIKDIDKTFLTLFAYYKPKNKEDEILYSYALDEDECRFKITKTDDIDKLKIERIDKDIDKDKYNVVTFRDETKFANSIIEDTKNNFITGLIGLGNMILFKERPKIIKTLKEF